MLDLCHVFQAKVNCVCVTAAHNKSYVMTGPVKQFQDIFLWVHILIMRKPLHIHMEALRDAGILEGLSRGGISAYTELWRQPLLETWVHMPIIVLLSEE